MSHKISGFVSFFVNIWNACILLTKLKNCTPNGEQAGGIIANSWLENDCKIMLSSGTFF